MNTEDTIEEREENIQEIDRKLQLLCDEAERLRLIMKLEYCHHRISTGEQEKFSHELDHCITVIMGMWNEYRSFP